MTDKPVKRSRGHPKKLLTAEQLEQLPGLAAVLNLEQIADYFGIAKNTLLARMNEDESIRALYKKGRANAIGAIANTLIKQAREGNLTAAIFYLKTQAGWKEVQGVEMGGKDGAPLTAPTFVIQPVISANAIESTDSD